MRGWVITIVLLACGGRTTDAVDAAVPPQNPTDPGPADAAPAKPRLGPRELIFHNQEDDPALASGIAVIRRATDESDIEDYALYWASDAQPIGAALATLPASGRDPVFEVDDFTKRPTGATHLFAYSRNAAGETGSAPASLAFVPPTFVQISKDSGHGMPRAVFDSSNRRLIVETNGYANRYYLCKPDGTVSGGGVVEPKPLGGDFAMTIDDKGKRLVTAFPNGGFVGCVLPGAGCTSSGGTAVSGSPDLVFDPINGRALGVIADAQSKHMILFGAAPNTSAYFTKDIGAYTGSNALAVDAKNQKLLVVFDSATAGLRMLRCGLDGSSCELDDISTGHTASLYALRLPLLVGDDGLLAIADEFDAMKNSLHLYRAGLDGSAPVRTPIVGRSVWDRKAVSSILDGVGHRFVVSRVEDDSLRPAMTRCRTDGTACRERTLDSTRTTKQLGAAFDATSRMLYVAVANEPLWTVGVILFGI